MGFFDIFKRKTEKDDANLERGLAKTKEGVLSKIARVLVGKSKVDDDVLDDLEEVLVTSDVGVDTTLKIIDRIQARVAKDKYIGSDELNRVLREEIIALLEENESKIEQNDYTDGVPYVIMVVGVNGVGKTTTIGKMAARFKAAGKSVV